MNGLVANLALLPLRRIVRAIVVVGCCVLSVSLIGAVHTRTWDGPVVTKALPAVTKAPVSTKSVATDVFVSEPDDVYEPVDHDDHDVPATDVGLAAFPSALTERTLTQAAPVASMIAPVLPAVPSTAGSFRIVWMEVTAYCPCKKCCGPRAQGLTASGRPVTHNGGKFVAADKGLPFNTKLLIPGYASGQAVPVLDRGGAIKGPRLDVYFPTHEQAKQWGRRFVPVTVLN